MDYFPIFNDKERQVFVVLGDGPFEEKLLSALAPKFDGGHKSLAVTRPPTGRITTLTALRGLAVVLDTGYAINKSLFVVDREHAQDLRDVNLKLQEYGFDILESDEIIVGKTAILKIRRGAHTIMLFAVIAGRIRCMDEEVADLASATYGKPVTPEEAKNLRGREIKELVDGSSKTDIKNSIPGLTAMLEIMEQDC